MSHEIGNDTSSSMQKCSNYLLVDFYYRLCYSITRKKV